MLMLCYYIKLGFPDDTTSMYFVATRKIMNTYKYIFRFHKL